MTIATHLLVAAVVIYIVERLACAVGAHRTTVASDHEGRLECSRCRRRFDRYR